MTALLLCGCLPGGNGGGGGGGGSNEKVEDGSYNGYYDLNTYNLNGLTGPKLQFELHKLVIATHSHYVNYGEIESYLNKTTKHDSTDRISADKDANEWWYTGRETKLGDKSGTREHVWPCANTDGLWDHSVLTEKSIGGGADLYHVRPCDDAVNTFRGNSRFKELTEDERANCYEMGDARKDPGPYKLAGVGYNDKKEYCQFVEPDDHFKGDTVRLLMYVYIHYAKMGDYNVQGLCGNLNLSAVMGYNDQTELYEVMLKWNELDPVSETEKLRNETVQAVQGNRNPFVDYPHLMAKCFNM